MKKHEAKNKNKKQTERSFNKQRQNGQQDLREKVFHLSAYNGDVLPANLQ